MAINRNDFLTDDEWKHAREGSEILEHVQLKSFQVSPQTIEPFEEAQLSWEVTGDNPPLFGVLVNGVKVANMGAATVNHIFTTEYKIVADVWPLKNQLGQITLVVNHDHCFVGTIPHDAVWLSVFNDLVNRFERVEEITLPEPHRHSLVVTINHEGLGIKVFLQIITYFFTAHINLTFKFSVKLEASGEVRTPLIDVIVETDELGFVSNVLSAGLANAGVAIVREVIRACAKAMLGPQLENNLASGLQKEIKARSEAVGHGDDHLLRVTTIESEIGGHILFECCRLSQGARFTDVLRSSTLSSSEFRP